MVSRRTQWIIAGIGIAAIALFSALPGDGNADAPATGNDAMAVTAATAAPGPQVTPAAAGFGAGAAPAPAMPRPASGAGSPDNGALQTTQIVDHNGFSEPLIAVTIGIPAGWTSNGGVVWNAAAQCHGDMVHIDWAAHAPDGSVSYGLQRGLSWQDPATAIPTNPCPLVALGNVREFLTAVARADHPQARILDYRHDVEGTRKAEEEWHQLVQEMTARGEQPVGTTTVESGQLLIGWTEGNREMREVLATTISRNRLSQRNAYSTSGVQRMRAPDGQLDLALFTRIGRSMETDPRWKKAMNARVMNQIQRFHDNQYAMIMSDHQRKMRGIVAKGMADRHAMRMQTQKEIAGIYSQINADRQAMGDRMHRRRLEQIGEYGSYYGIGNTVVQHSIHAPQRVFQHSDFPERIISTDEPYFRPPSGYVEIEQMR